MSETSETKRNERVILIMVYLVGMNTQEFSTLKLSM